MNILNSCLSPSWGGLEMIALENAEWLAQEGHYCKTLCIVDSPLEKKLKEKNLPYLSFSKPGFKYFSPQISRGIAAELKTRDYSACFVIHLKDLWFLYPPLRKNSVKLIAVFQMLMGYNKKDFLHGLIYGRINLFVCVTEQQKRNALEFLPLSKEQIVIIPNSVDLSRFSKKLSSPLIRKELGAKDNTIPLIGLIGRLDPMKGQVESAEAARILKEKGLKFHMVFVGEDTLNTPGTKKRIEDYILRHDLQDVITLAGFRSDIPAVMASLDIFMMPSYEETFGRVLIEAMGSHTVLVSTRAGGVPDIIDDGVNGLLVEPKSGAALALALEKLLTDTELRHRLADNAFEKAHKFYDNKIVQAQYAKLL